MGKKPTRARDLRRNGGANLVYEMKVTLRGIRPPIWRKIHVTGDTRLWVLHGILQSVMGWNDEHPHRFLINGTYYGEPVLSDSILKVVDEESVCLNQLVSGENTKFLYEYGTGWGWDHEILIEKILSRGDGEQYPICRDGNLACPPEHCGSPSGYRAFLKSLNGKSGSEGNNGQESVGDVFNPEKFNVEEINRRLGWS